MLAGMLSYGSAKGYKNQPGAIENRSRPKDKIWEVTALDKTKYSIILKTKVTGANKHKIIKEEWITTNCVLKTEIKRTKKFRMRLLAKAI